ncbi:MAG: FAD-dependent oxidoreductase [bacterium]
MTRDEFPYTTTSWDTGSPSLTAPLSHDIDVDVAVVGGGFVGLSSARALKEADPSLRIAVLEAEHLGFGASGRGSGMIVPFLHSAGSVARVFGWDEARWAARYLIDQAGALKEFIRAESIACDYQYSPLIVAATNDNQAQWLKQRSFELSRCGYEVEVLAAEQLRELVGYPTKAGIIIRDESFGQLQPFALAQGFSEVIRRKGVQVYEHTLVQRFDIHPDKVALLTHEGATVTAQKLVLAAGAQIRKLGWGRFRLFPIAVHSYMLATEPLDGATLEELGSGLATASVIDAGPSFYYLRTFQNRLLIGGAAAMFSKADEAADRDVKQYRKVLAELHRRFPFLKEASLAAAWAGPIQSNLTELPTVQSLPNSPNVVLNVAYVNGVPLSYLAGRLIVGLVLGSSYADPEVERLRRVFDRTGHSLSELFRFGLALVR